MHILTLEQLRNLVHSMPVLTARREPHPFPGKKAPTRIAWHIEADFGRSPQPRRDAQGRIYMTPKIDRWERLKYVGKPCRYRALEALSLFRRAQKDARAIGMWQCEFDADGLIAYEIYNSCQPIFCDAYFAYHPQGGTVNPMAAFGQKVYVKPIGKFPTYSQQKKLSQEQVDQFYTWWQAHFEKRKLRRPRQKSVQAAPIPKVAPLQTEATTFTFHNATDPFPSGFPNIERGAPEEVIPPPGPSMEGRDRHETLLWFAPGGIAIYYDRRTHMYSAERATITDLEEAVRYVRTFEDRVQLWSDRFQVWEDMRR